MELREELKRNVEEFKAKEQEEKERAYRNRIEKIKEILETIEADMINASREGRTEIEIVRVDNGIEENYVEDIKKYFSEKGFKVRHKTQTFFNYGFVGVFELHTTFKHTLVISWKE